MKTHRILLSVFIVLIFLGTGSADTLPTVPRTIISFYDTNDKVSSIRWVQKKENLPHMTLDQQIELVGLYGKFGQSGKIGQKKYTRNLNDRIAQELHNPNLTQSRKEDHVDVMLELKAHERVLPHLKELPYQQSGDWVYPYDETLEKLGRNKEFIDFFRITDDLRFDFSTGFSNDNRVNSKRPLASLKLVYDSLSNFEVGVNTEFHKETARRSNGTFTQFGAFLTWKF